MSEIVNIPDDNFRKCILKKLNKPKDYKITKEDCESITNIDYSYRGIKNLGGIEYFTNLKNLYCEYNKLTSLDLSKNKKLKELNCYNNQLINLNLSNNTELERIICSTNNLTHLDLSKNIKLQNLFLEGSNLSSLDLSNNISLTELSYSKITDVTHLDLSKNTKL